MKFASRNIIYNTMILKNLSRSALTKANKELHKLLLKIVKTKKGGKRGRALNKNTGKLQRSLNPVIVVKNNSLELSITVIDYYKYLDEGTKSITKPWFLTDELTNSKEFKDIIADIYISAFTNSILKQ